MKNITESAITAAVDRVSDPKNERSLRESVNLLLSEAAGVPSAGSKVAIIDDPTYAVPGVRGTVTVLHRKRSLGSVNNFGTPRYCTA